MLEPFICLLITISILLGSGLPFHVELLVVAREQNLNKSDGETTHKVCNMTIHPQRSITAKDNDFAILNLCEPLMFDKGNFLTLTAQFTQHNNNLLPSCAANLST